MPLTTVNPALLDTQAQYTGFKNRIINGDMRIDQRNAGASVTPSSTVADTYSLDRWCTYGSAASKFSVQQNAGSVTPPAGFRNYIGVTSLAATSVGASDQYYLAQYIEGFNTADLMFGSASASTITFSFWVRSSLTGTFGGSLTNSALNRSYPFSYTISSANTWEQKFITLTGDTSGTWLTTNGVGLRVHFGLGVGSSLSGTAGAWAGSAFISATGAVSVVGTNGATFYITGVQLEKGSTATSFDYRPYGTELQLCQRYCYVLAPGVGNVRAALSGNFASTLAFPTAFLPVPMRGSITLSVSNVSHFKTEQLNGGTQTTTAISIANAGPGDPQVTLVVTVGSSLSYPINFLTDNTAAKLTYSAEL
jgi:hypothetical protein